MLCEEQSEADAERVNGEVTSAPLAGLLTVTLANAGKAKLENTRTATETLLNIGMKNPWRCHGSSRATKSARGIPCFRTSHQKTAAAFLSAPKTHLAFPVRYCSLIVVWRSSSEVEIIGVLGAPAFGLNPGLACRQGALEQGHPCTRTGPATTLFCFKSKEFLRSRQPCKNFPHQTNISTRIGKNYLVKPLVFRLLLALSYCVERRRQGCPMGAGAAPLRAG
jgi:hypothetical protein